MVLYSFINKKLRHLENQGFRLNKTLLRAVPKRSPKHCEIFIPWIKKIIPLLGSRYNAHSKFIWGKISFSRYCFTTPEVYSRKMFFFFGMSQKVELLKKRIKDSINLNWTFLNLRLQLYRKIFGPVSVINSLKKFYLYKTG